MGRIGIWLVGARGGVATTVTLGLLAMQKNLVGTQGLVSELPQFEPLKLAGFDQFVVGGHEIRDTTLRQEAMQLAEVSRAVDRHLVESCGEELDAIDQSIRPGVVYNVGKTILNLADESHRLPADTPRTCVDAIKKDLQEFSEKQNLDSLIVINVASTEPPIDDSELPGTWSELNDQLSSSDCALPASSLYAIAALELKAAYLNFTPSLGSKPAAICELAEKQEACHYGHDGKTGETLLKSSLAPMFANRNLEVMSWVGHNIFGNMDGQVLDDPENKKTKVVSKDRLLGQIFGYDPQTLVSIEYIKSLGDWKTAWDHIHFRGFLGTPMVMQFTWQGCDSLLAAPLVLDLARFTARAVEQGDSGLLTFLASFFKSPIGVEENNFERQFQMLESWSQNAAT